MSISDLIVVMKLGVVQQIGKPQEIYDNPVNLFVAKFLGTPPINVFEGKIEGEKLYIGDSAVLDAPGHDDKPVYVTVRPEGFVPDENGPLTCDLNGVEVMGRDVSIVGKHPALVSASIRAIVDADYRVGVGGETVSFSLKPHKVFMFDKETEERIYFGGEEVAEFLKERVDAVKAVNVEEDV